MSWQDDLEVVLAHTKHEAFRAKCADSNPNATERISYRQRMTELARSFKGGQQYPAVHRQIVNAAGAVARVASAAVQGQPVLVSQEAREQRQAICNECPEWDAAQARCRKCGCGGAKLWLATEKCPLEKW